MSPIAILLLIVGCLAGGVAVVGGIVFAALRLAAHGSGWSLLAARHPGERSAEGAQRLVVMRVGKVMYRNCVRVAVSPHGLALDTWLPGHLPLLIPWSAVKSLGTDRLQWQQVVTVDLTEPDEPRITLPERYRAALAQACQSDQPVTAQLASV